MNDNQELFIDESMIKNINDYNSIKDEIICEICQGILIKPKQCEICESIFCEKCINSWLAKNNSCPKRCDKFVMKDCPKLMKKILDKLIIQCPLCKNEFNYDSFVYKHYNICVEEKKMVKCPLCGDCQIKYKTLMEYNNKLKEEKNEILKELEKYKNKMNELKNNNKSNLKWSKVQKYQGFSLADEDRKITINYSGCYTMYFIDYLFSGNIEYSICIHSNTFGKLYDYVYIGFINENFNNNYDCLCCFPGNAFYIRIDDEKIYYNGLNGFELQTKVNNKTNFSLKFNLDLKNNELEIKDYDTDKSYGKVDVTGKQFKFFVSKCNSGTIEYTIL